MSSAISLGNGGVTFVDDDDFDWLNQWKWHRNSGGYVWRTVKTGKVTLHRLITGAGPGQHVDHINHDRLDNRRANLRLCTPRENNWNRPGSSFSGLKGVSPFRGRWRAVITLGGRQLWLGLHETAEAAARAYDEAATKHFGDFAFLNYPASQPNSNTG
jgi:hypothetical protein